MHQRYKVQVLVKLVIAQNVSRMRLGSVTGQHKIIRNCKHFSKGTKGTVVRKAINSA